MASRVTENRIFDRLATDRRHRPLSAASALAAAGEARATAYSRAVAGYASAHGAQFSIGCSANEAAAYLRSRICGGKLFTDPALAALLDLANAEELAALTADTLTQQRINEFLQA